MTKKREFRANNSRFDLFPDLLPKRPKKPPVPKASCARCGKMFAAPRRQGRPDRYCGFECRKSAKAEMSARFERERKSPDLVPGPCRTCGKAIVIDRRPGRFPYFCSPACKRLALHPTLPRGGDLFNPERNDQ